MNERVLTTMISENDGTASLDLARSVAAEFGLRNKDAAVVAAEVGAAVAQWRAVAAQSGIRKADIDRMASAFEHDDLAQALA